MPRLCVVCFLHKLSRLHPPQARKHLCPSSLSGLTVDVSATLKVFERDPREPFDSEVTSPHVRQGSLEVSPLVVAFKVPLKIDKFQLEESKDYSYPEVYESRLQFEIWVGFSAYSHPPLLGRNSTFKTLKPAATEECVAWVVRVTLWVSMLRITNIRPEPAKLSWP